MKSVDQFERTVPGYLLLPLEYSDHLNLIFNSSHEIYNYIKMGGGEEEVAIILIIVLVSF